jgi:rare lipoprotein A (peptidoglycan hydrolase)
MLAGRMAFSISRAVGLALGLLVVTASVAAADEGYASWYGPGFHGNRMANGQVFNMHDPTTTANNEYPMGTWLRVTNPSNGKSVVVQVRDRGGFGAGLDLSRAAFFALDPPNGWGFRVKYERVSGPDAGPAPPPPAPAPAPKPAEPPKAAPPKPAETPKAAEAPVPAPIKGDEYVVMAGDTLRRIAQASGVPVPQLVELNELPDPDSLPIGRTIRLKPKVKTYTVQPGDTLNRIAESLDADRERILGANDLSDPDLLTPGQLLKVPA